MVNWTLVEQSILSQRLLQDTFLSEVRLPHELHSTNTQALEIGATEVKLPLLVWTLNQTAGRGRGANAWWSAAGSLTCTTLIEPAQYSIPRDRWPALSLNVGVAVCSLLQRLQLPEVRLKWPNDVYIASRKVCGILIESVPTRPERLAVGIGLNVNNTLAAAPAEVRQRATSLVDEVGMTTPLIEILVSLLHELHDVLRLCGTSPEMFPALWNQLSWLTGREVQIDDVCGQTRGQVLSIETDGALSVLTRLGPVRVVSGTVAVCEP